MSDVTVEILKEIRDEIRATNGQVAATNERLDVVVERLDRLDRRQSDAEIRLATEVIAVVGAVRDLKDAVMADRELRRDIADHERRLRALESKTG